MPAPRPRRARMVLGAVPAASLSAEFPILSLPIQPPLPPMEAARAEALPSGSAWVFEPKWDGFRCLAFRREDQLVLQSKSGQPLGRYFPEVVEALLGLRSRRFVLDGELVVNSGRPDDFDRLLARIHPAASRIERLARDSPASFVAFDLLVDARGVDRMAQPFAVRRRRLVELLERGPAGLALLTPQTGERPTALAWLASARSGFDGVVAKDSTAPYRPGDRRAMRKVKRLRTADCVVGGFRPSAGGDAVGSLLLGLYSAPGVLDHVGFVAGFSRAARAALGPIVKPLLGSPGFTGKAPGGPSRWARGRDTAWRPLRPVLVCEVSYDHWGGDRFRHGTRFLRWRPDKRPEQCTVAQVRSRE